MSHRKMATKQTSDRTKAVANVQDVIYGRGNHLKKHPGNIHYRSLVNALKDYYVVVAKEHKSVVCALVYESIKGQDPPGRFLEEHSEGEYTELGSKDVLPKIGQCFRERQRVIKAKAASDVIQILSKDEFHIKIQEMQQILLEMNIKRCIGNSNDYSSSFLVTHDSMTSCALKSVNTSPTDACLLPPQKREDFTFEYGHYLDPFTFLYTAENHTENQELERMSGRPSPNIFFGEDSNAKTQYQIDEKYGSLLHVTSDEDCISLIRTSVHRMEDFESVMGFQPRDNFPFLPDENTMEFISYFLNSKEDFTPVRKSNNEDFTLDDITQDGEAVHANLIPMNSWSNPHTDFYTT